MKINNYKNLTKKNTNDIFFTKFKEIQKKTNKYYRNFNNTYSHQRNTYTIKEHYIRYRMKNMKTKKIEKKTCCPLFKKKLT